MHLSIEEFQDQILSWYRTHARDFLPRRHTHNPYHIMLSEVMSHQTQISRVVEYRTIWTKKLPNIADLAQLDTPSLLQMWQGLGYNNRALRLRDTCRIIIQDYDGILPHDPQILMTLPGIGRYTAHAIASFAYNLPYPVLDTNIKRVWYHHFPDAMKMKESDLIDFARQFIPEGQSALRHSALMDYGSLELAMHKSGIRINSKQSTFRGSTRRVRSHIIKHCLAQGPTSIQLLYATYAKPRDYDVAEFDSIITKMIENKLIANNNSIIAIMQ